MYIILSIIPLAAGIVISILAGRKLSESVRGKIYIGLRIALALLYIIPIAILKIWEALYPFTFIGGLTLGLGMYIERQKKKKPQ